MINDSKVVIEGYLTGKEGSQITVRCQFGGSNQSESVISTCVFGGIWSPDPAEHLMCEGTHALIIVHDSFNFYRHAYALHEPDELLALTRKVKIIIIQCHKDINRFSMAPQLFTLHQKHKGRFTTRR